MIWEIENAFQISLRCDLLGKKEERKRVDAQVCGNCSSAACGGLEPEVVRQCRLAADVSSAGPDLGCRFPRQGYQVLPERLTPSRILMAFIETGWWE